VHLPLLRAVKRTAPVRQATHCEGQTEGSHRRQQEGQKALGQVGGAS